MTTVSIKRDELRDILYGEHDSGTVVEDTLVEVTRWAVLHRLVFNLNDVTYIVTYRVGATECQEERPWDNDGEDIKCTVAKRVTITRDEWAPA